MVVLKSKKKKWKPKNKLSQTLINANPVKGGDYFLLRYLACIWAGGVECHMDE